MLQEASLDFCIVAIHFLSISYESVCSPVTFSHVSVLSLSFCACTAMSVSRSHAVWFQGSLPGKNILLSGWPSLSGWLILVDSINTRRVVKLLKSLTLKLVWVYFIIDFQHQSLFLYRYMWNSLKMRSVYWSNRWGPSCLYSVCFKVKNELGLVLHAI